MKMRNIMKRGLVGAMALTMILGNTVVTQAKTWGISNVIPVQDNIYDIDLEYEVYNENETPSRTPMDITNLDVPTSAQQKKSGTVYTMTPPEIEGKIYSGYEVKDKDGNIVTPYRPGQQNPAYPSIQTDPNTDDINVNGTDYTLILVYENVWEKATITFDKNSVDAVGTMESQEVDKGSTVNLNANQFVYAKYVFLGWSTSPDGGSDGLPEYQDQASITLGGDITLYAIWGTPDMYLNLNADRTSISIGDETGFTMIVTNRNTPRSTTLYNAAVEISFTRYINYVDGSVKVYMNGLPVNITESFNPVTQKLVIPLGTMEPRDNYTINFIGKAKVATSQTLVHAGLDGDVTPATRATTTGSNNKIHMSTTSQSIRIR